jgi:hypothetical protein
MSCLADRCVPGDRALDGDQRRPDLNTISSSTHHATMIALPVMAEAWL